jgi:hypothetical protein
MKTERTILPRRTIYLDYLVSRVNFENMDEIINYIVPLYKKQFPKNSKFLCGMIGVSIFQNTDYHVSDQDHYVSFCL